MSLNWREIDLILAEADIVGAQVQKVVQPVYDTLVLSLYKTGRAFDLLVCVAHGACRLHLTTRAVPKAPRPIRFCELLRSRIVNGRVMEAVQLGPERIVRITVRRRDENGADTDYRLYLRLWSGAANVILTDPEGVIVDTLARKPLRGEVAGGRYAPDADSVSANAPVGAAAEAPKPRREFVVRDLPGEGSFNARVDAFYAESSGALSRERLLERVRTRGEGQRAAIENRLAELAKAAAEYADPDRYRELGDILMAHTSERIIDRFLEAEDFFRGGTVRIAVDSAKSVVDNAKSYYERHRKASSGREEIAAEIAVAHKRLSDLATELALLEAEENPFKLRAALDKAEGPRRTDSKGYGGISLDRNGWTILVGRSAKENDELLRRHVRGSDTWLHARDWAGAYVFVKARAGKTIPLDILIDAGTLAVYYSKGRSAGKGDLYYTQVKYLRRAKNGPLGLVIPTQERNLHVMIDERKLKELKALIGGEA